MVVLFEDPEGNIQLGIDNENPYIKIEDEEPIEDSLTVIVDQMSITMDRSRFDAAIRLHKIMTVVKTLALFDFIFNFFSFMLTYYLFYLAAAFCSLIGYTGVIKYDRGYIFLYLVYQVIQSIGKILVSIYVLSNSSEYSTPVLILAPTFAGIQLLSYTCVQTLYLALPA